MVMLVPVTAYDPICHCVGVSEYDSGLFQGPLILCLRESLPPELLCMSPC